MRYPQIVSREEWLVARKALFAQESLTHHGCPERVITTNTGLEKVPNCVVQSECLLDA